tara:strand:+ start:175 stop:318 length:144 start_codon:yes stop_codon:yes gene_type:complete
MDHRISFFISFAYSFTRFRYEAKTNSIWDAAQRKTEALQKQKSVTKG